MQKGTALSSSAMEKMTGHRVSQEESPISSDRNPSGVQLHPMKAAVSGFAQQDECRQEQHP